MAARWRLAIAVPTYNEAAALPDLLGALEAQASGMPHVETTVLVIDDNSPDGTAEVARSLAGSFHHIGVEVLLRPAKHGLGAAYVAGLTHLLDRSDVDLVAQMDADLSHDPGYLPAMLEAIEAGADVVVGSRYIPGGDTPDWSLHRRLVSRLGNRYARLWLGSAITDHTGGFNVYRADVLRSVKVETLSADGYGFVVELKHRLLEAGAAVRQVPIVFKDRRVGKSKIPRSTMLEEIVLVPRLALTSRRVRREPGTGSARGTGRTRRTRP